MSDGTEIYRADSWTHLSPVSSDPGQVIPPVIQGYEIIEMLGRGGMGIVYRARDTRLGRLVALKMLAPGTASVEALRDRFQKETKAIANLQHANIASLYESGDCNGSPWFAMELLSGRSMQDRLVEGPLTPHQAAEDVSILAKAMHYCHQQGVIHRDLKPANILSTENGTLKITDFGIAKLLDHPDSVTRTGDILGTPSYLSPEQASGVVKQINATCDVYALGAILYHCLTGAPPFRGPDPLTVVMRVLSDDPIPPRRLQSGVPRDLDTICMKCLEKVPTKRYPTAQALAEELERFLRDEPIRARPVGIFGRTLKWAKRRPAIASLIGILLAIVITMIFGAMRYNAELRAEWKRTRELSDAGQRLAEWLVFDHSSKLNLLSGTNDLKDQLANHLLDYLNKMVTASCDRDKDSFIRQSAIAYERIAEVLGDPQYSNLGRTSDALAAYQRSLQLWEQLVPRGEDVGHRVQWLECRRRIAITADRLHPRPDTILELARIRDELQLLPRDGNTARDVLLVLSQVSIDLAEWEIEAGRPDQSLENTSDAMVTIDELRKLEVPTKLLQALTINLHRLRGLALQQRQEYAAAAVALEDALSMLRKSGDQRKWNHHQWLQLSSILVAYGDTVWELERMDDAALAYAEAEQIRRRLIREDPSNLSLLSHLMVTIDRMGYVHDVRQNRSEQVNAYREIIQLAEKLLETDASDLDYQSKLIHGCIGLAEALTATAEYAEARLALEKIQPLLKTLVPLTSDRPTAAQIVGDAMTAYGSVAAAESTSPSLSDLQRAALRDEALQHWDRASEAYRLVAENPALAPGAEENLADLDRRRKELSP